MPIALVCSLCKNPLRCILTMCELVCMLDLNITFKKKAEDEGEKEEEEEIGIGQEEKEITTL